MYRREIEISFSQRIKEAEDRFSGDQESVAKRFQADVWKLEQHYQSELKALSKSHVKQKLHWEAQIQEALENAEEQRRMMEETMDKERESLDQQWKKERHELESLHKEKMEELVMKNQQLQNELDDYISMAQTKEIELSRQLNDLHNRLQESLETRDKLLAQSEKKALETELLLNQTVEDFKQERAELLSSQSALEAKNNEMLSISERQITERIELLTERDDLRMKLEELEMLLKQAAVDFELERKELQEHISILEKELKDNLENDREDVIAERDHLKTRIRELEMEFNQVLSSVEKAKEEIKESWAETVQEVKGEPEVDCCSAEIRHEDLEATSCDGRNPDSPIPDENHSRVESKKEAVSAEMQCEAVSSLEAFEGVDANEDGENKAARESCEEEDKPQDVPALDSESPSHEEPCHETVVDPSALEEMDDPDELSFVDAEVTCFPNNFHRQEAELVSDSDCECLTTKIKDECAHDFLETPDEDADWEDRECSLLKLQALCNTATEENILLHEKISLLQQKTEILETLLSHNSEKIKTSHQVLDENYSLKVKMILLMEHVKGLEMKALKMTDLQIRYEDCMCENAKLKDQNGELEKRVWSLESRMNIFHDFHDQQISLVDEIGRMREGNSKLSELVSELERQGEVLSAEQTGQSESPTEETLLDLTSQLELKAQAAADLDDHCEEFEKQNTNLRRAITELQDKSQTLNETTQAHR